VIAAVNGHAYAGGLEMMLACDFAYAVPAARFALTEVTLGIMPGAGGTQLLPRAVGERRAKELILTGRPFAAESARDWGLVNRLVEREALMDEALATAAAIADNAPLAVRQAKKAIHAGLQLDLRSGLLFEIEAYNRLVPSADRREGIRAFNEKRKPRFTGR
jgi:enoyl-CoA hydratase